MQFFYSLFLREHSTPCAYEMRIPYSDVHVNTVTVAQATGSASIHLLYYTHLSNCSYYRALHSMC